MSPSTQGDGRPLGGGAAVTVKESDVVLVRLPEVPVIVTVTVPVVAVPFALSVNVLLVVVLVGLNDAVTPLGIPVADKLTLPLKPFTGVTVIVLVFALPCTMLKLLGDADNVKFAAATAFTVKESEVLFVRLPEVPVIVTVTVRVAAVPLAVSVKVLLPEVLVGLNDADTPLGIPVADKLTLPLKPFSGVTLMVLVPLVPCVSVRLAGDADSEKFGTGGALTVKVSFVVLVKVPEVPVTVIVAVPIVAVLVAVSVRVLLPEVLEGLNAALTPLGRPDADRLTFPLKPFCGTTLMVLVPLVPWVTVRLDGNAESVKFGVGGGGVVTDTLSNVAVASAEVSPLHTARPTYTLCPIVTVRLLPSCVQFTPSLDTYPVTELPLRVTLIQYGSAALWPEGSFVVPPVVARKSNSMALDTGQKAVLAFAAPAARVSRIITPATAKGLDEPGKLTSRASMLPSPVKV